MNSPLKIPASRRRGMTLVELMLALTILSILSVGATNLIIGGLQTDRVLLDSDRQVSEMEHSIRRQIHNIRTGTAVTIGANTISMTSQADPNNNGQTYTITYTYSSAAGTLSESSTQYGTNPPVNVIAYNVTAFSAAQISTPPQLISVDITIAATTTAPPTRRTFQIMNRNS